MRATERLYYAVARRIDAAVGNRYSMWCILGHIMALVPAELVGCSAHDSLTDRLGR